jgi:flagellar protein FliO/FliZ
MLELAIRLVFSLAVVLGLLALLTKFGSRRFRGRNDAMVQVLHRQHLSRGTTVSVVTVGSRVLVLGTTEHQVHVLAELEPDEVMEHLAGPALDSATDDDADAADDADADAEVLTLPTSSESVLAGSVLSVDTWRQAFAAASRKAS